VVGSPGWGVVNHDSHVMIEDNVSFDVFGAGFVTEIGNELGSFRRNIAILGRGSQRHIKDAGCSFSSNTCRRQDLAHGGHGFWFQGRNLLVEDNVAISQHDAAYVYFHRSSPSSSGTSNDGFEYVEQDDLLRHPSIIKASFPDELDQSNPVYNKSTFYDRAPIVVNRRNTAYNSADALHIVKSGIEQHHDYRNTFEDFLGWGNIHGIQLEYVSQYTFRRMRLYADAETRLEDCGYVGIRFGSDVRKDLVFENPIVKDYSLPVFIGLHEQTNVRLSLIDHSFINHMGGTTPGCWNTPFPSNGVLSLDPTMQLQVMTGAQLGSAPVSYVRTQATVLNHGGWQFPTVTLGTKTDRLGTSAHESVWDHAHMLPRRVGFHRLADGTPVVQLREIYADRLDGSIIEYQENVPIPPNEQGSLNQFVFLGPPPSLANARPIASADSVSAVRNDLNGYESILLNTSLLANDTDADGNPLRIDVTWVEQPANGKVALFADGSFMYMPNPGFTGTDQFRYRSTDTRIDSTPAVVTLNVTASVIGDIFRNGFE
jgi:Bacterial Ig domain